MYRTWLAPTGDLAADLRLVVGAGSDPKSELLAMGALANRNHDFASMARLDRAISKTLTVLGGEIPASFVPEKLAILSTSTSSHLGPSIRVACFGRQIVSALYEPDYGLIQQELLDQGSGLHGFAPTTVLFADDPYSLFGTTGLAGIDDAAGASAAVEDLVSSLRRRWQAVRTSFSAQVIQQLPFNPFVRLLGENESRLPGSPASLIAAFQAHLRAACNEDGVDLIDLAHWSARDGLAQWHSVALWHRSKQEVHPRCAPLYGDLVARILAARRGKSAKCLVLDLDNTLWGGVIGDDGLDAIAIGQGSAIGEGHLALQHYAKMLARRGIILAVCSKNDHATAMLPFEQHPDMALRATDISSFVANWTDKATNLRRIASDLNIGLDSLVFADDNPFERDLIRQELPDVHVAELADEPSDYAQILADSGWFESVSLTSEDLAKTEQYRTNAERRALLEETTDLESYVGALAMELDSAPFTLLEMPRIVQLINKTNQFNLTTRRHGEAAVRGMIDDPDTVTRRFRLTDRFGDNGLIATVIGVLGGDDKETMVLDTWLMSCRVLGRRVEHAILNVMVDAARQAGARRIIGEYLPTERNGLVKSLYSDLGFSLIDQSEDGSRWLLDCSVYQPHPTSMKILG